LRIEDLPYRTDNNSWFFLEQHPVSLTSDGYYYLTLSKLLQRQEYQGVNRLRVAPDHPPLPQTAPLLSQLTAWLSSMTGLSLLTSATLLTLFLPPLALVPMYWFTRYYGGHVAALVACGIFSCAAAFTQRSSLSWYDTDILNICFLLLLLSTSACYATAGTTQKRQLSLFLWVFTSITWAWWWDSIRHIVLLICAGSMVLAIYLKRPASKRDTAHLLAAFAVVFAATLAFFPEVLGPVFHSLEAQFNYLTKQDTSAFPRASIYVSEQVSPALFTVLTEMAGGIPGIALAIAGAALVIASRQPVALMILPLACLAFMSFFAHRYAMFAVPLTALCIGVCVEFFWQKRHEFTLMKLTPVLVIALLAQIVLPQLKRPQIPVFTAQMLQGMPEITLHTPKTSVIWSWWDHGYPLNFLASRATINDGSSHSGERNVYTSLPLVSNSDRFAANFMHFYVAHGVSGIQRFYNQEAGGVNSGLQLIKSILSVGPGPAEGLIAQAMTDGTLSGRNTEEWQAFFFPKSAPVYLYLDQHTLRSVSTIQFHGSWSPIDQNGDRDPYLAFYDLKPSSNSELMAHGGITIDLSTASVQLPTNSIPLSNQSPISSPINQSHFRFSHLRTIESDGVNTMNNDLPIQYYLTWNKNTKVASFTSKENADSLINRLFIEQSQRATSNHFRLISGKASEYQLWEVLSDRQLQNQ
jgi:dolichyl-diphosphooligosaccharide--protein glycosyltransferase